MANRQESIDEFNRISGWPLQESGQGGRIIRRSEMVAFERNLAARRSSTGTSGKPVLVQGKVKRKRRPPKVPWKKPQGMPKRPLSGYNFFFAHEREQMLKQALTEKHQEELTDDMNIDTDIPRPPSPPRSASVEGYDDSETDSSLSPSKARRVHTKSSGIGFANMAKTIASKWKSLDPEERRPFEAQAAIEKEKYRGEMVIWRAKQLKEKQEKDEEEKKKIKPKILQRRQSSPPDHHPPAPDATGSSPVRRLSEPISTMRLSLVDVAFDIPLGDQRNETSSWAEPMGGGSLGSSDEILDLEEHDWEPTLDIDLSRQRPRRTYSDTMLEIRPDFSDVRPCEELVADLSSAIVREEAKEASTISSSLKALQASLDDDMVDFLTTLRPSSPDS